ncbi:MAG: hypothetical protein HQM00_03985 [Magnetococcales bacterium]|nr:hypothetical protein [Magnetococcales bacterium]
MKTMIALFFALLLLAGSDPLLAGELIVPHQPGDSVTLHVRPGRYAHPSDYWWQKDPSTQGAWDYFTPVDHLHQPVLLEAQPTGEVTAAIPVTNRPLR